MKELTIEQKARAYDEAKARMSRAYNSNRCTIGFMNEIFPEFKDEDERIKEEIINYFECQSRDEPCRKSIHDKWIAWIEKQGQTFTKEDTDNANKVEPKFKADDWVVSPNGVYWHIDRIENNRYEVTSDTGKCADWPLDIDLYHLWSIKDAKEGDMLAVEPINDYPSPFIAIYKERGLDFFNSYCFIGFNGNFYEGEGGHTIEGIHPATKEQQDTFFAKIREAGYEWDADKLELRKIEQRMISAEAKEAMYGNPAWSEEDEEIYSRICYLIHSAAFENYDVDEVGKELGEYAKITDWLKTIKTRYTWKPSDEQIIELRRVISGCSYDIEPLAEMEEQLKKLREE